MTERNPEVDLGQEVQINNHAKFNTSRFEQARNYAGRLAGLLGKPVELLVQGRKFKFRAEANGNEVIFDGPSFSDKMTPVHTEMKLGEVHVVTHQEAWTKPYNFDRNGIRRRGPGRAKARKSARH